MNKEGSPVVTSMHIEKTGGTSGVKVFENAVGRQHLAFYDPVDDSPQSMRNWNDVQRVVDDIRNI